MSGYALDTNIISFLLRGNRALQDKIYTMANAGHAIVIPSIAFYEVKRGLLDCNATSKLKAFEQLCDALSVDDIGMDTLEAASKVYVSLKQQGQMIDDSDILIGASCIARGHILITDNTRHFDRIDGLSIENWSK